MSEFSRLAISVFYRRVEVVGADRLPARGPVIVAANHHNLLVDPMLLLAALERPLVPLAKAPLFRYPLIGAFLKIVGAIPVHRKEDPDADPAANADMFRSAITALGAGRALLIFPEGRSQSQPVLLPLKTGAARMLLAAEAAHAGRLGVRLVPAGLVYHEPGRFRVGRALVAVGDPVDTADCVAQYVAAPQEAVRRLTERLAGRLRGLIVEADDRETLRLLDMLETMAREEAAPAGGEAARAAWMQQAMRAYRWLRARDPARVEGFRQRLERYVKVSERAGLTPDRSLHGTSGPAVWSQAVRETAALVLGLPLAAIGMALHGAPYWLTRLAIALLPHATDEAATYAIVAGTVLFPLGWAVEGWAAWQLGGGPALAVLLGVLLPSAFFALAWRDRVASLRREARVILRMLRDPRLAPRLAEQRQALLQEMDALARTVPADTLA